MSNVEKMVVISLAISRYSGTRKDREAERSSVKSGGVVHVVDKAALTPFGTVYAQAHKVPHAVGVKLVGGDYVVAAAEAPAVLAQLQTLSEEFNELADRFTADFENLVETQALSAADADDAAQIRAGLEVKPELRQKFRFKVIPYRVGEFSGYGEEFEEFQESLGDQLFREIGQQAEVLFDRSLKGRTEVTQKALRPVKAIRAKLSSLAFLNAGAPVIIAKIDETLQNLPKTGKLDGVELDRLTGLVAILRDPGEALDHVSGVYCQDADEAEDVSDDVDETIIAPPVDAAVVDATPTHAATPAPVQSSQVPFQLF